MSTTPTRHPWNADFTWRDHDGPLTTITPAQAEAFDRDGFFVADNLLDAAAVARTIDEIDHYEAKVERFLQKQAEGRALIAESGAITFTTHLVTRSPWLRELAAHPTIAGIMADLIGPNVRLYWDQAVYKKPEKPRRFPWHQDNGYAFVEPQQYVTCWIALTDATVTNGCPQVVPGLHRLGTIAHTYVEPLGWECLESHPDARAVEVAAGGAVVFSSLTPHLTGPNTTDAVRKSYILQYAPDGAVAFRRNDLGPPPPERPDPEPQDAEERQFFVVQDGQRVAPPPLALIDGGSS